MTMSLSFIMTFLGCCSWIFPSPLAMASGFQKKKSKRMSCRRRFKIERKVKEHNRKVRKETKLKAKTSGSRVKSITVPNKCPFKEDILKEAQKRKEEAEELLLKRKEDRHKAVNKKRNLESVMAEATSKRMTHETTVTDKPASQSKETNDSSLKAYFSEVKRVIETSDVILEVVDARDPIGSRCPEMEESVLSANKRLVLLLNKIDLVPKANVESWVKYLRNELPTVAFKASTQEQNQKLGSATHAVTYGTSRCIGANILMKLLGNYCRNKDVKTAIRVGVVGFPNVGKSSVINSLKRSKACNTGSTPGITKCLQEVELDKKIRLIDSPGVVIATKGLDRAELVLRNTMRIEAVDDPIVPVEAILRRCKKDALMLQYNIADFQDATEFLALVATRLGRIRKGGVPDINGAAKKVLTDWTSGKIRYFTVPPETHEMPNYISCELVQGFGKEFDIDALDSDQAMLFNELPSTVFPDAITLPSTGFTSGVLTEAQMERNVDSDVEMEHSGDPGIAKVVTDVQLKTKSAKKIAGVPDKDATGDSELPGNQQRNKKLRLQLKRSRKLKRKAEGSFTDLYGKVEGKSGNAAKDSSYDFDVDFD